MKTTTLTEAKQVRAAVLAEVAAHRKVCACWPASAQIPGAYCDQGWALALRLAAARSEVAGHQARLVDHYPWLF